MQGAVAREEIELSFKRYILEKTEAFAHEPMEDVYRVNLLGQMLDRYDWMEDKTSLAVPGFDEVLHWGGEPGRIGWYFVRSGNQAVFFYYEGRMEEEDLLALLAEHLADAQQTA